MGEVASLLVDVLGASRNPEVERTVDILVALKDGLTVGSDLDSPAMQETVRDVVTAVLDARMSSLA